MWDEPPGDLELDAAYIDVWRTRIDLPKEELEFYASTLSKEEKARAAKFRFPNKYDEYVVSRGLLRKALAHVLGKPATEFEFSYTDSDKPFLAANDSEPVVSFNLSHSHGQTLLAVSLDRNIGIDIEKVRTDVEYEKLAKRFFSEAEHNALMQLSPGERAHAFFAIWTRKEAFVKAIGKGIAFGLSEFDVNIDPYEPPQMLVTQWKPEDASHWLMATIETDSNYMATLATDGGEFKLRYWK